VPEQELDLLQIPTVLPAEFRAGAAKTDHASGPFGGGRLPPPIVFV
jgi:hypothetical protein